MIDLTVIFLASWDLESTTSFFCLTDLDCLLRFGLQPQFFSCIDRVDCEKTDGGRLYAGPNPIFIIISFVYSFLFILLSHLTALLPQ